MQEDMNYYSVGKEAVMKRLDTSAKGLSEKKAKARLEKYGNNQIENKKKTPLIIIFLSQFNDFLIMLLLFATAISVVLGELLDAVAMIAIIILSTIMGFIQEYRAEKAMEALEKMAAPSSTVIRSGIEIKVPSSSIVPGDIVVIEAGDIIPADVRIIEAHNLEIDESSLTGESVAVRKTIEKLNPNLSVSDQRNMAFSGTAVTYGEGKAVAVSTGMKTEIGKIASSIQSSKETKTPLQVKFDAMAKQIGIAVIVLVFVVFVAGFLFQDTTIPKMLIFALSLAVAAVPSSLPAIVTIGLALGARALSKKNMIVKRLPAAESLGSVTMICTDKTGTITRNEMTATRIFFDGMNISVSGSGYNTSGSFSHNGGKISKEELELPLKIAWLCNNAKLNLSKNGKGSIIGDPTEGALVVLSEKAGFSNDYYESNYLILEQLPFDSDRKMMSVLTRSKKSKKKELYVKGAPDILLDKCSSIYDRGTIRKMTASDRKRILRINNEYAENALRVLGLAFREANDLDPKKITANEAESGLVFTGLVGMIDPARMEVADSIEKCRAAGIRVMVITGDHAITARAVAKEIGLYQEGDIVITGKELDEMDDDELFKKIRNIRIIARALPIQKVRIVEALQQHGHIVAMTGDGVNDAPAIKKADIGLAMGITGTDVAKEVSKAILADDNFATIVNAVEEGRNIYDKVIKSTRYLLSCNTGEILSVFTAIMIGMPLPMVPLQILMMNLVTDGLPALALGVEPHDEDIMRRKPRNPKQNPLTRNMLIMILLFGAVMAAGTVFLFRMYMSSTGNISYARTVAFTALVMFEMFAVFGSRSLKAFVKLSPFSNIMLILAVLSSLVLQAIVIYTPFMQRVFETVPLSFNDWIYIILVSSIGFLVMELSKLFLKEDEVSETV